MYTYKFMFRLFGKLYLSPAQMKNTFTVVLLLPFMFQDTTYVNGLEDFVMCRGSENRKIQCSKPNELIDIKSARLIYANGRNHCDTISYIIMQIQSHMKFPCERKLPLLSCHGQRQCIVDDRLVGSGVHCQQFYNSNVLYIKYSCYKFDEKSTARLTLRNVRVAGETVDVISPNFPCIIPKQDENYSIQCVVKSLKFRSEETTTTSVKYKLIRFQPPSGSDNNTSQECLYGIKGKNENESFSQCNNKIGIREVRDNSNIGLIQVELTQEIDFFTLFYNASNETTGGIFWLQIKGERNSLPAGISVSCNNSKGLLSLPKTPDRCNLFPEVLSLATTEATTTAELKSQEKLFKEGVFYGAIGGLIVLICLLLFIIVILIYFVRKRNHEEKHGEELRVASPTTPTTVEIMVTENYGQITKKDRLTKRKKAKNIIEDHDNETVMIENKDLYEATNINHTEATIQFYDNRQEGNVPKRGEEDVNHETCNGDTQCPQRS